MKIKDITAKSDKELATLLADTRSELAQLTLDMRTKQIPNVKQSAVLKRTIARVLTVQRARELNQEVTNG
jgi:large subunit ribosomal protein L29